MNLKEHIKIQSVELQCALMVDRARRKAGLTQQELAEKCEMKQESISRIESGGHMPTLWSMKRILTACDVNEMTLHFNPKNK